MINIELIHPTAIIHPDAQLAADVQVGPYSIIGPNVSIAEGTKIFSHVVIAENTRIGRHNEIFQFCSIGERCQDLKYKDEDTWLEIGDYNSIREHSTLHRGTIQDQGLTQVGSHNLLMVNTHIAHDCIIGDHNIIANNAGIAGHVHIADYVIIGGNSGIHQFCHIDSYSMIGGASLIVKDVPAFVMASGNPAHAHGMNFEGMRRKGWTKETIDGLKQAFKILYRSNATTKEAIEQIEQDILPTVPEAQLLIDSLKNSKRGIVR
ncbi:acyl-ACP--UDP-N-acetylglucosamine O-acyltransferase [Acinetobacter qingfengensis]|uniref:Acyl-[acyl-carrier-protein]--UDP-N-acetylglucosamine O-acyltransferase n=1 Tax=Acinetobacter qingfengensis TaxID=1262585 RepID=A0A1E7RDW6_9GAMM|nr:acyl-ACP--UDP-N-acetylglucosamine O-acyltransferase [Acinetobacter qingfengensis]KAA8734382.1 acyl-ACP--UDP-N-acetylglucosamine O-acyltransferase [Acinetobacter qingfengensis]OEY97609.1 acyl-[acyl-carrier-protein]--UDP-N-acetylglucosamine O-acyltransferase [Acinetobacter qingfengensis]